MRNSATRCGPARRPWGVVGLIERGGLQRQLVRLAIVAVLPGQQGRQRRLSVAGIRRQLREARVGNGFLEFGLGGFRVVGAGVGEGSLNQLDGRR